MLSWVPSVVRGILLSNKCSFCKLYRRNIDSEIEIMEARKGECGFLTLFYKCYILSPLYFSLYTKRSIEEFTFVSGFNLSENSIISENSSLGNSLL